MYKPWAYLRSNSMLYDLARFSYVLSRLHDHLKRGETEEAKRYIETEIEVIRLMRQAEH